MKKPRFTKCGFFVFLAFKSHCVLFWGALEAIHEPNNEKTTFYKVWFFRFLPLKAIVYCFGGPWTPC